jgi:hypothetical protein
MTSFRPQLGCPGQILELPPDEQLGELPPAVDPGSKDFILARP